MMVEEWCTSRGAILIHWGPQFKYSSKKASAAATTCQVESIRIAFLHMYGSSKEGPYFNNNYATSEDPFVDTVLRIPEAIQYYTNNFGKPNFVIFRTELWDLQPITVDVKYMGVQKRFNESWYVDHAEEVGTLFTNDHIADITQIRSLLPSAYVGAHTIPTIKWGLHMFHHFTNAMRYVSSLTHSFLFDFNLMLAHMSDKKDEYLRDYHHPNEMYTVRFVDILTGALQAWSRCTVARGDATLLQGLIRLANHSSYYVTYGVRRPVASVENYAFYSQMLPILYDGTQKHQQQQQQQQHQHGTLNIHSEKDMKSVLDTMHEGSPLSRIFKEDSLVLPPGTTQVYWLSQGQKRPISGIDVFYARGWDFADVNHISADYEFEYSLVPLGPEL
jgi:hypothetical protein